VTQISASHFDDETAYVSVSRFRIDDLHPLIYRTHDGGRSWQQITAGIPADEPVDTVREDPVRRGLLYAGTEKSVWVSFDDGSRWQSLQLNLPHTSMRDLWIKDDDLIVATHGRSFWVLDDVSPLRQLSAAVASAKVHLFQPAPAYRVMRSSYTDTPYPPDEPMAANPPDGAVIDYLLASPAKGPLTLEVLDAADNVVRRYRSDDPPALSEQELQHQLIPPYWVRPSRNPGTSAGMHRFVWDLHYAAPASLRHGYPISAVPHDTPRGPFGVRALPGQYRVRITVDDVMLTAPLTVKIDPRVKTPPDALKRQFELATALASLLNDGSTAVAQARSVRAQLEKVAPKAKGGTARAVAALETRVRGLLEGGSGASGAPALASLVSRVAGLYESVEQSDAGPTAAQTSAGDALKQQLPALLGEWQAIARKELPAVNGKLRGARLPVVRPEAGANGADPGVDRDEG
jgi:hypothetical protein